ncbi:MAG: sugar phosphate isomerase/epimerase [bacterium]|nr:sugar phosphate isomerase/epimerase [bacterium]
MFKSLSTGAIGVKATLNEGLAYAKAAGFGGLDVSIAELAKVVEDRGASEVKGMFEEAGLKIGAWGLPVAWNGTDAEYAKSLEGLSKLAAAGASVGAFRVSQWVPSSSPERKFRENWRWHLERFRPICEILKEYGCNLGLEFIGPRTHRVGKQFGFIYTMDGMMGFCEALGTGNAGLLLDAWHWYTGLGTLADLQALQASDVVYVHVNDAPDGVDVADQIDNVRTLPAETGVIDLPGFLGVLNELGYEGPVTVEPFSQRVRELPPADAVKETAASLVKAWQAAGLK